MTSTALISQSLPIPSALGSLEAYISAVNQVPVFTVEEEQELARAFHDDEDLGAARHLVMAHLRFVVHVARGYQGYGLGMGDLIQEGNIGLMKAVKRFDPDHGVRLVELCSALGNVRKFMNTFCVTGALLKSLPPKHNVNYFLIFANLKSVWVG